MKPDDSPCKDCEDRTVQPNCHTTCIAYKRYRAERERVNGMHREFMIQFHDEQKGSRAEYGRRK